MRNIVFPIFSILVVSQFRELLEFFSIAFQFHQFWNNLTFIMLNLQDSEQPQTLKIYLSFFCMTLWLGRTFVMHIKSWWQKISSFRSWKCIMQLISLLSVLEIGEWLFRFGIKKLIGYIFVSCSKIFSHCLNIPSCLCCQQGSLPAIMVFENYQHSNCSYTCS